MIWDNFSIFKTNCAIRRPRHTRVHAARIVCGCRAGEMASEIHEIFYAFGPQLKTLCLLEFGLSIFVISCSSLSEVRQYRI